MGSGEHLIWSSSPRHALLVSVLMTVLLGPRATTLCVSLAVNRVTDTGVGRLADAAAAGAFTGLQVLALNSTHCVLQGVRWRGGDGMRGLRRGGWRS